MKYFIGFLVVAGLFVGATSWWVLDTVHQSTGKSTDELSVTVTKGAGVRDISAALAKQHLVRSPQAWTLYVILTGSRSDILTGTYILNHNMTGQDILHTLTAAPKNDREVTVKIPDGSTSVEIGALLEKANVISADNFLAAVQTKDSRTLITDATYDFLRDKPTSVGLEGFLFPDTYRFFKQSTASAVMRKFLDNFNLKYSSEMRTATKASGRTIFEEVTMGSILEKELKTEADRAKGADVFWKRITIGMALQSNATVLFAAGKSEDNLSIADTKFDSPYNTYINKGLPPGPINNPSLKSIRAAIYPEANPYYYFLSSPTTGTTYFAKTLEEHNANKVKYLQ